jgi:signal transduction histidine kinase
MRIKDLSVRKRLMFSNFMMILIPVVLLLLITTIGFLGLRRTSDSWRINKVAMLWPTSGPTISTQLAISSLRVEVDHAKGSNIDMHEVREACQSLEAQGAQVAIMNGNKVLYVTRDSNASTVIAAVHKRYAGKGSGLFWDEDGFAFKYGSAKSTVTAFAVGTVPFLTNAGAPVVNWKYVLEIIAYSVVGIMIFIIVTTGVFLSRRLSKEFIVPLEKLSKAAYEVGKGNLEYTISTDMKNEIGDTCREFDKMRLQLKAAKKMQEKYEQNRKELMVGISHDLSTPLTSIKGYTSGLLDGIATTAEKKRHYLNMIYKTSCNMEKLVESLFLFSKLDLEKVKFTLEEVNIKDYFTDYLAENADRLMARGLHMSFQCQGTTFLTFIDRIQFQRVVENLVENSLKYKRNEIVNFIISLGNEDEDKIRLDFIDDGLGVPVFALAKIFENFYRTDPARTNVSKGSGLGLAIVKQIITTLQGKIWAKNNDSGGLTICILLPVVRKRKI